MEKEIRIKQENLRNYLNRLQLKIDFLSKLADVKEAHLKKFMKEYEDISDQELTKICLMLDKDEEFFCKDYEKNLKREKIDDEIEILINKFLACLKEGQ